MVGRPESRLFLQAVAAMLHPTSFGRILELLTPNLLAEPYYPHRLVTAFNWETVQEAFFYEIVAPV
jgi:hypothetical protein